MIIGCYRTLLVVLCLSLLPPLAAAGDSFPFGTTLMLDAGPIGGSKRIPMLELAEIGAASVDLWCVFPFGGWPIGQGRVYGSLAPPQSHDPPLGRFEITVAALIVKHSRIGVALKRVEHFVTGLAYFRITGGKRG